MHKVTSVIEVYVSDSF